MDLYQKYSVDNLRRHGFAIVKSLISPLQVNELREHYRQVVTRQTDCGENDRWLGDLHRQVMFPDQKDPYFRQCVAIERARQIYQRVWSGHGKFHWCMLISKEAHSPHPVGWHQDMAYAKTPAAPAGTRTDQTLQFWLPLQNVDEQSGCLHYLPGNHTRTLPHEVVQGDPQSPARMLSAVGIDPSPRVTIPLQAGDCTIHLSGTLHFSDGNFGPIRRDAFIFNICPTLSTRLRQKLPGFSLDSNLFR